jgi:ribosome-associated translation inhibitor RaiA
MAIPMIPLQITFRDMDHSDSVEDYVRKRAIKLSAVRRIVACKVAVEAPHRHKNHGRHYRVRIDMTVPGSEVVVDRCPDVGDACADVYAAIDYAFDHALRRLRDGAKRKLPVRARAVAR